MIYWHSFKNDHSFNEWLDIHIFISNRTVKQDFILAEINRQEDGDIDYNG
jgi:hypothetical protein